MLSLFGFVGKIFKSAFKPSIREMQKSANEVMNKFSKNMHSLIKTGEIVFEKVLTGAELKALNIAEK